MCREGDKMGIRDLLEMRQLSVHDREEYGRTLFSVSPPATIIEQ